MTTVHDLRSPARPGTYRAGSSTARARLVISALSLLAFLIGLAGLVLGVHGLRVLGFVGYFLFGIGAAPWALLPRIELPLRMALSVGTALSMIVLFSTAMLESGGWRPALATTLICAITVALHVLGIARAFRERGPRLRPDAAALGPGVLVAGTGVLICLVSAVLHVHTDPGLWGFLAQIGPLWYAGLGLVVVGLAISWAYAEAAVAIVTTTLVTVLTGTPALVYDMTRIQSSAKHVELIQQIRTEHLLQSTVDVYNGWPGFFSGLAWLSDAAGIHDPINLAKAWQLLIGLGVLVTMRYFAGQVIKDRKLAWLAVVLCVLPNTIGQDYFSPQSVGYALGILIFGLALSDLPLRYKVPALVVPALTVSISHQLSPYIIGGALCVLVVFRLLTPWWLPATVLGAAIAWTAINWSDLGGFVDLTSIGSTQNLAPPTPGASSGLSRLPVFLAMEAALALSLAIVGLLGLLVLWRRRREIRVWALAAAPGAGVAIIVAHPYGKEGIYRAALFSLPWLAVLAAQAFPVDLSYAWTRKWQIVRFAVTGVLTVNFLVGTFALDASNVMRRADREGFAAYARTPTEGAVNYCLVLGPGDLPSAPITGALTHVSIYRSDIDNDGFTIVQGSTTALVGKLTEALIDYSGSDDPTGRLFAFWSPTSSYYGWEYGLQTPEQFAALRDAFVASPAWKVVFSEDGTVLFEYTGA